MVVGGASARSRRKFLSACDVLEAAWSEGDRIAVHIEISLSQLDPPEGVIVRVPCRDDGPLGEPQAFVGWLGLFGVLQSLAVEQVDRPP